MNNTKYENLTYVKRDFMGIIVPITIGEESSNLILSDKEAASLGVELIAAVEDDEIRDLLIDHFFIPLMDEINNGEDVWETENEEEEEEEIIFGNILDAEYTTDTKELMIEMRMEKEHRVNGFSLTFNIDELSLFIRILENHRKQIEINRSINAERQMRERKNANNNG